MSASPQYEEAVLLALRLSPLATVRLVERIVATLKDDLTGTAEPSKPLYSVFAVPGLRPSVEDIAESRREMWSGFD
jgi:hypothetical protein